jgi:small subunit ribosomal protein S16
MVVAPSTVRRDGKFIEVLGTYNPQAHARAEELKLKMDRIDHWLGVGAQPTDTAKSLIRQGRLSPEEWLERSEKKASTKLARTKKSTGAPVLEESVPATETEAKSEEPAEAKKAEAVKESPAAEEEAPAEPEAEAKSEEPAEAKKAEAVKESPAAEEEAPAEPEAEAKSEEPAEAKKAEAVEESPAAEEEAPAEPEAKSEEDSDEDAKEEDPKES